jgi:D-glycero-D-manno-heptose 1,7-bisphosphate phosphatase
VGRTLISAVFVDRDGVINVNIPKNYVRNPDVLVFLRGASAAISKLNDANIPVVLISNQQGVGKGLMTREALNEVEFAMRQRIFEEAGAEITKSYYCVHLSGDDCQCRKPKGGQLRTAAHELSIDLANSIFIGDSPTDIQAGRDARIGHCALVLSGANKSFIPGLWPADPDTIHRDLAAAVEWIFKQSDSR